jgi:hypothetical protein
MSHYASRQKTEGINHEQMMKYFVVQKSRQVTVELAMPVNLVSLASNICSFLSPTPT